MNSESLRAAAEHLASVCRSAQAMVEAAEGESERRQAAARALAELVGEVDLEAMNRIASAADAAGAAQVESARSIAEEVSRLAARKALELVNAYAGTLGETAAQLNHNLEARAEEIAGVLGRADPQAAAGLMAAVERAGRDRSEVAARQAEVIARSAQSAMRQPSAPPAGGSPSQPPTAEAAVTVKPRGRRSGKRQAAPAPQPVPEQR